MLDPDLLQRLNYGCVRVCLENPAQVGSADIKMMRDIFDGCGPVVFMYIGKNLRNVINTGRGIFGKPHGVGMVALQVSEEQSEHQMRDLLAVILIFAELQHHIKNQIFYYIISCGIKQDVIRGSVFIQCIAEKVKQGMVSDNKVCQGMFHGTGTDQNVDYNTVIKNCNRMLQFRRNDAECAFFQERFLRQSVVKKESLLTCPAVYISHFDKTVGMLEQRQISRMLSDGNLQILLEPKLVRKLGMSPRINCDRTVIVNGCVNVLEQVVHIIGKSVILLKQLKQNIFGSRTVMLPVIGFQSGFDWAVLFQPVYDICMIHSKPPKKNIV